MTLKENDAGFRGHYNRKEHQIYLERRKYDILTLEPIHCLIENATYDTMTERITIDECICYIEQQEKIINGDILEEEINKLCFEEVSKELINQNAPDGNFYYDHKKIYNILSSIIELSRIYLRNVNEPVEKKKQIQVSSLDILSDGMGKFNLFMNGKKIKEFLFKVKSLAYYQISLTNSHPIIVYLENIDNYDHGYRSFGSARLHFGNEDKKIIINDDYEIIIDY